MPNKSNIYFWGIFLLGILYLFSVYHSIVNKFCKSANFNGGMVDDI